MDILIVYGSQFGTTERVARAMGAALAPEHVVRIEHARDATRSTGREVDLLMVGAPTQMHGLRLLVRPFLSGLGRREFRDVAAAAFDTRGEGPVEATGSAAAAIAKRLEHAGCRLVVPPESFFVADLKGPLADGEAERAADWARTVAAAATPIAVASA